MQSSIKKKSWIRRNPTYAVFIPMFVGCHIGWFMIQQYYVAPADRHDHPLIQLYKRLAT